MEINYAPMINRINCLSENILCSKNNRIVTETFKNPGNKKKITLAV